MKENKFLAKLAKLKPYGIAVAFLCLEMVAFIGFALGHNFILYGALAIVISILLALVTYKEITKDGIVSYGLFLFPLVIFSILSAISTYPVAGLGAIGVPNAVFIPLTLIFLSICGYLVSRVQKFDTSKILLVIYGSLGLFVLVNLIATMIYYVPFYTLIYKNSFIVYEGEPSPVPIGQMAYMLYGFKFMEVSLYYWRLFPAILSTSLLATLFIKFKENKKVFLIYLSLGLLGLISLLFTISKYTLLTDLLLIVLFICLIISFKLPKSRKIIKIGVITVGILFVVALVVVMINAQSNLAFADSLKGIIEGNELLNRLFNTNRFIKPINEVFDSIFTSYKIFGLGLGSFAVPDSNLSIVSSTDTICWFVDSFNTSGIFGAIFIAVFIVLVGRKIIEYFKTSTDLDVNKILLIGFIVATLGYMFVGYDSTPLIYYEYDITNPFYMFPPFLLTIFLISYMFGQISLKKENKLENKNTEEVKDEEISL